MRRHLAIALLFASALMAHADDAWEPTDIHTVGVSSPAPEADTGLFEAAALHLIHYYQKDISTNTIDRCPFLVSCSHFAALEIADKGLVPGLVIFIDRFYYRENTAAFGLYPLVQTGNVLKIDDREYVK